MYDFPAANQPIISSLRLPEVYLISKDSHVDPHFMLATLESCYAGGLGMFQLRLCSRDMNMFPELLFDLKQLTDKYNARLILNGDAKDAERFDVDGIHLNSRQLFNYTGRPLAGHFLLGASCHNEKELKQAERINADYVFISPVNITGSHPGQAAIGWDEFERLSRSTNIPAYALGGMSAQDRKMARRKSGQGIAMISAVWGAEIPEQVIKSALV